MNRTGWLLRLELSSDPEILSVVRSAVASLAANLGFPEGESRALTRAVDEALANVIRHAYGNCLGRPIELRCRLINEGNGADERPALELVLIDSGAAVNRKKLCGRALDDVRPGGLGMHFIQNGVDVMEYSRRLHRNRLRLVKYLPAQQPERTSAKGEK